MSKIFELIFSLIITTNTYVKDTYELIDYLNGKFTIQKFTINTPKKILRNKFNIKLENLTYKRTYKQRKLGKITINDGNYFYNSNSTILNLNDKEEIYNLSWFLHQNKNYNKIYKLSEGDIIKLGKVILYVREINIRKNNKENSFENENETYLEKKDNNKSIKINNLIKNSLIQKISPLKKCRICYSIEDDSINNPLIKPCNCLGTLKYVHYYCLLKWLSSKIPIKKYTFLNNNFFYIFEINHIECEICKGKLPDYIKHNGKIYSLIDFEKYNFGDFNYIIFDSFQMDKLYKGFRYVIKFDFIKNIIIGRGNEANIIINDISISRKQCEFIINYNGDVILNDLNSKFGTLILIQNKILPILKNQKLNIQIGRTFINFEIKEKFSLFNCCNVSEINLFKSYDQFNKINLNKKNIKIENNINDNEENNEEEYEKIKDKNLNHFKIILNEENDNNNSIEIKNQNNDLTLIHQPESLNLTSIVFKNTITIDNDNLNKKNIIDKIEEKSIISNDK